MATYPIMTKQWWAAAGIRALKTTAQTFIATAGVSEIITQVDWKVVAGSALLSAILSLATSLAGLPELGAEENTPNGSQPDA